MSSRVTALANLIRSRQEQGERKFVVMLGAGASLASGMPLTPSRHGCSKAINRGGGHLDLIRRVISRLMQRATPEVFRLGPPLVRDLGLSDERPAAVDR
jgi:hypothetical protein